MRAECCCLLHKERRLGDDVIMLAISSASDLVQKIPRASIAALAQSSMLYLLDRTYRYGRTSQALWMETIIYLFTILWTIDVSCTCIYFSRSLAPIASLSLIVIKYSLVMRLLRFACTSRLDRFIILIWSVIRLTVRLHFSSSSSSIVFNVPFPSFSPLLAQCWANLLPVYSNSLAKRSSKPTMLQPSGLSCCVRNCKVNSPEVASSA